MSGKTLEVQLGGWKPSANDLMHLQAGVSEMSSHLHKGMMPLANQPFAAIVGYRLWGLQMTLSNSNLTLTWTEGAIFYGGKTLLVAAGTANRTNASTETWIYQPQTAWGQAEYETTAPQDTRRTDTATLVAVAVSAFGTRYDTPYLGEVISGGAVEQPAVLAGHFTADAGAWTVNPAQVTRTLTVALNKRAVWDVFVLTSTTGGAATQLNITLPSGMTCGRLATGFGTITGTGITGAEVVRWSVLPGQTQMNIFRMDGSAFPVSMSFNAQVSFIAQ